MPRIPVSIEPYSSPGHQYRHFKSKRDRILRALCRSCYINKSNFAILLVNSKGDYETYASEAFQGQLKLWFNQNVLNDARRLALAYQKSTEAFKNISLKKQSENKENMGLKGNGNDRKSFSSEGNLEVSQKTTSIKTLDKGMLLYDESLTDNSSNLVPTSSKSLKLKTVPLSDVSNINSYNCQIQGDLNKVGSLSELKVPEVSNIHEKIDQIVPEKIEYKSLVIGDTSEVTAFMESRFKQLQQSICKIVAKAWIKVIEPKKQTRYPYNKGDRSKPSWWPKNVRHKEPDHLMKPERINLLLSILRCSKIPISRLELATAEVSAFIPADKTNLLREIYYVAREEEKMRNGEIDKSTKIYTMSTVDTVFLDSKQSQLDKVKTTRDIVAQKYFFCDETMNEQDNYLHKSSLRQNHPYIPDSVEPKDQTYLKDQEHFPYEYSFKKHDKIELVKKSMDTCVKNDHIQHSRINDVSVTKKMNDFIHSMGFSDLKMNNMCYSSWPAGVSCSDKFSISAFDNVSALNSVSWTDPTHLFYQHSVLSASDSCSGLPTYLTGDVTSQKCYEQVPEIFQANDFVFKSHSNYSGTDLQNLSLCADGFHNDELSNASFYASLKTPFLSTDIVKFPECLNNLQTSELEKVSCEYLVEEGQDGS